MDIVTYALAKKMASSVSSGITEVQTDGTNIRFKTANGDWFTVRLNSVDGATISSNGHLIIELTDGTTLDAGALPVGTMDSSLSTTSENGVQNKVITTALNGKQNILTASTGVTIDTTDPSNPTISANIDYTNLINKPTKLSDFTNDEDFINNTVNNLTNYYLKTETYTQTEVNNLISQLTSLSIDIVEELPTTDISTTTIYLINVSGTNNYNQWMYINNAWANLGSTSVDLTKYYTKGQTDTLLDSKVDKVIGKGLSTNDFTNAYKSVLDSYTVDSTLDSSSTNPIQNGTVTDALNTKQPKTLSSPITIGGVTSATVESALGNLNSLCDTKQPKTLSSPITIGGVTSATVESALGNLNSLCDTKLPIVTSLPLTPSNQETVLYVGTSSGGLKSGGIYQYQVSEWVLISYAEIADKTVNDITLNIPSVTENGQYVIPLGNILEPTSTEGDSPYNWDITGFLSIIRPVFGHNVSHLWFEAGHGYSHNWMTYAYLDKLDSRFVTTSIKAFQYNGKWWLGLCIITEHQGYVGKMTITYSSGLLATPTCILYNSRSGGVANEEIYNSIQDIPSSWWRGRAIYNPTTFDQNITAPNITSLEQRVTALESKLLKGE